MRLQNKKGQSAVEMMLLIGMVVLLIVPIVSSTFFTYMKSFGDSLKANFQAEVRYAVSEKVVGSGVGSLGLRGSYPLEYQFNSGGENKHPYAFIKPGWSN